MLITSCTKAPNSYPPSPDKKKSAGSVSEAYHNNQPGRVQTQEVLPGERDSNPEGLATGWRAETEEVCSCYTGQTNSEGDFGHSSPKLLPGFKGLRAQTSGRWTRHASMPLRLEPSHTGLCSQECARDQLEGPRTVQRCKFVFTTGPTCFPSLFWLNQTLQEPALGV